MNFKFAATVVALSLASLPAFAAESEATFDRTLSVNGRVELSVFTGAGNVHLTRGSGNEIRIHGHVQSNWGSGEDRVRDVAAHPPIEQTGNIVRIGAHSEMLHNISIDYDIQAPAESFLEAHSGSGDITDDGVGENAKLGTGSGNIHASGLHGGFSVSTGSGDIVAEQNNGTGDVTARTGSGNIDLRNLHGSLHAGTGSGDIKAAGTPEGEWRITTGSGNIELWPGNAGFNLDAHTGSGDVHTEREMTVQGSFDHHHTAGRVNGGGPTVYIQTGSGDVRIH